MSVLTPVSAVFSDNPILEKDASLLLRRKLAAAAWGLVALGLTGIAGLAWAENSRGDIRMWGSLSPPGGEMLLVVLGFVLAGISVVLAALAATSITSEREQGTLPLLMISGLSPARIIAGKYAALITAAAPFVAIALPLFALCSVFLGVDGNAVALAIAVVFAHALAVAATGVWASAVSQRMRTAALTSLAAAALPCLLGALPVFASLVACIEDQHPEYLVVGVVGIVVELLIAAAALVGAWSVLAPGSALRWPPARLLVVAATLMVPMFGGLVLGAAQAVSSIKQDTGVCVFALVLGVIAVTQALAPALSGRRRTVPSAARVSLMVFVLGLAGTGIAWVSIPGVINGPKVEDWLAFFVTWFAGAGIVAFAARWLKNPIVVVVVLAAVLGVLFGIPAVIDEFTYGAPPLAFLNPVYVIDRSDVSVIPTLLFYGAVGLVTFMAAARGARSAHSAHSTR